MLTNNAANMKWVVTEKSDNTNPVTKQSVVHMISWVNSNALTKPKLNMQESWNMSFRATHSVTKSPRSSSHF